MKNKGRKRNKSSPLAQNPTKKLNIKDYFESQKMNMSSNQGNLSIETLAACAEAERDIEALKDKSLEEIIKEMARDIKDIKLQQTLDKQELKGLK